MLSKKYFNICLCTILFFTITTNAQNINVGGVFPTIDHSGTLTSKLNYSLYYFGAFPLINFDKSDISKDSYFHLYIVV